MNLKLKVHAISTSRKRARRRTPSPDARAAFHEAGHVVLHIEKRLPFEFVTIEPGEHNGLRYAGLVQGKMPARRTIEEVGAGRLRREHWEGWVMCQLAGMAAESIHSGHNDWRGAGKDHCDAYDLVSRHVGSHEETLAYLDLLAIQTRQRLQLPWIWERVEIVAQALQDRRHLTARQVRSVLRAHDSAEATRRAERVAALLAGAIVMGKAES